MFNFKLHHKTHRGALILFIVFNKSGSFRSNNALSRKGPGWQKKSRRHNCRREGVAKFIVDDRLHHQTAADKENRSTKRSNHTERGRFRNDGDDGSGSTIAGEGEG